MPHPALKPGNLAVVTGGASGIGLAAARRFAGLGLNLCLIDRGRQRLEAAIDEIRRTVPVSKGAMFMDADVGSRADMASAATLVGDIDVLMNNAGIGPATSALDPEGWEATLTANLMGVVHGCQAFVPAMIRSGRPGLVINTGSKQGITTPPGNPAYNVSKAGVKVYTEALQHELRNGLNPAVTAHLFIPGFVWTGLTAHGSDAPKPEGAWTPDQSAEFLIHGLIKGDFYILSPDNEVTRPLDEKRMAWAALDIIENRPPLSRWHPDYAEAFQAFLKT